ncbi:Major facilitator superfamily [Macrophomina phaseolina MS6]|uniref:Major facilitator superfamily n=1 Tax=Macrophomina phaseolina (strain MS6) TaxID=1126212 RepID=K2RTX2_MACPH|nr:Major facilitator superfamily [Macrophomina phaseolina MS6]
MGYSQDDDCSETSTFLPQQSKSISKGQKTRNRILGCALIGALFASLLVNLVTVLVLVRFRDGKPDFGGDVSNVAPTFSQELIHFSPGMVEYTLNYTSSEEAKTVRKRWQDLLPKGGGNVHIPNHDKYDKLSEPFLNSKGVPMWKVSWAHQLHCLYYVMDAYDQVVRHGPTGEEHKVQEGHHSVHTNHCFDYLRQAILCNGDMTLEGRTELDNTKGTDGYGHTHVCRSYNELVQWAEERRLVDERWIIAHDAPL